VMSFVSTETPAGAEAIRAAATNTSDATDFRIMMVTDGHSFIPGGRADGEVDGTSVRLVAGDLEFVRIGDTEWLGQGGSFESQPAVETFAPFGEASEAVISAALESGDVEDLGEERLDGVPDGVTATHYSIGVDDDARAALAEVPPTSQFWFVGETEQEVPLGDSEDAFRAGFLEDADRIDVWIADGLVHRIAVADGDTSFVYTFYDFGAEITIVAPS